MRARRVALFSSRIRPFFHGGVENRVWRFARHLAESNEVRVFTAFSGGSTTVAGIRMESVVQPWFEPREDTQRTLHQSLLYACALARAPYRHWAPDILLVESIPYVHLITLKRWASASKIPTVLLVDEAWVDYGYFKGLLQAPSALATRFCLSQGIDTATSVVAASRVTARSLRENFGVSDPRVIPNGFDGNVFSPATTRESGNTPYDFVMSGRLATSKRPFDFVEALDLLHRRSGWRGKAAIVGEGPLKEALLRLVASRGLRQQVDVLGRVSDAVLAELLRTSKVYVLTSEKEGFSMSTLEAMASGLPVIAAEPEHQEVYGVSELVRPGLNGRTFALGEIEELASQMDDLLSNPEGRIEMGRQSCTISRSYTWSNVLETLDIELQRLVR